MKESSFWDFGERISRLPRQKEKQPERGAAALERALKWRPWGRRVRAKLRNKRWHRARQRHLPRSPTATDSGTASTEHRPRSPGTAGAAPGHFALLRISFRSVLPSPGETGGVPGAENRAKAKASASPSFPHWLFTNSFKEIQTCPLQVLQFSPFFNITSSAFCRNP